MTPSQPLSYTVEHKVNHQQRSRTRCRECKGCLTASCRVIAKKKCSSCVQGQRDKCSRRLCEKMLVGTEGKKESGELVADSSKKEQTMKCGKCRGCLPCR